MTTAREHAEQELRAWVAETKSFGGVLDFSLGQRSGEFVIVCPGEAKLRTTLSVLVGSRTFSASAFVLRNPDENHAGVHHFLLQQNLRLHGVAFAVDRTGDVYLRGSLPTTGVSTATIDQLVGALVGAADGFFNKLLELGFASAIQAEWRWRVSRGESVANLAAFQHLADRSEEDNAPQEP